jgi:hypothetical protein
MRVVLKFKFVNYIEVYNFLLNGPFLRNLIKLESRAGIASITATSVKAGLQARSAMFVRKVHTLQ